MAILPAQWQRRSSRDIPYNRRTQEILCLVSVAVFLLVVGAAAGGVLLYQGSGEQASHSRTPAASLSTAPEEEISPTEQETSVSWEAGACVTPWVDPPGADGEQDESAFRAVACTDSDAGAKILKIDPKGSESTGDPGCPEDTDGTVDEADTEDGEDLDGTACIRNVNSSHPGSPGKGGGVLRKGDCFANTGREKGKYLIQEVPCDSDDADEKIVKQGSINIPCPPGTQGSRWQRGKGRIGFCSKKT